MTFTSLEAAVRKLGRMLAVAVGVSLVLPVAMQEMSLTSFGVAWAQEGQERQRGQEAPRRVQPMTERTYRRLADAQEMLDAEDFQGALRQLNSALNMRGLNPSELGQIHNMLAFTHFQLENYDDAIRHYEEIAALGENVTRGLEIQTLYSLAQLYMLTERYDRALHYHDMWMEREPDPGPEAYIFRGQIYYQMNNFVAAISTFERGIQMAQERGLTVRENWWQMLLFLNFEQENTARVIEILEILVRDFPKREYYMQLAGMYGQEGQERRQLETLEAAHTAGLFAQETDYLSYAGLLAQNQVPYRAAKWLTEGFERGVVSENERNLRSLAQYWHMAQEVDRAIPVYQQAAELAADGRTFAHLATLFLEKNELDQCVTASDRALQRGELRSRANSMMVRSMCLYEGDRLSDARTGFQQCARTARQENDASLERICQQWVTHVDRESSRREQLRAGL
jgi:tetratricopeptide (TPR) repeat protein